MTQCPRPAGSRQWLGLQRQGDITAARLAAQSCGRAEVPAARRPSNTDMPIHERKLAEGVGFEPTRERNPLPVFKTGALNHSATLPC
jgi:hypothetical protein